MIQVADVNIWPYMSSLKFNLSMKSPVTKNNFRYQEHRCLNRLLLEIVYQTVRKNLKNEKLEAAILENTYEYYNVH